MFIRASDESKIMDIIVMHFRFDTFSSLSYQWSICYNLLLMTVFGAGVSQETYKSLSHLFHSFVLLLQHFWSQSLIEFSKCCVARLPKQLVALHTYVSFWKGMILIRGWCGIFPVTRLARITISINIRWCPDLPGCKTLQNSINNPSLVAKFQIKQKVASIFYFFFRSSSIFKFVWS